MRLIKGPAHTANPLLNAVMSFAPVKPVPALRIWKDNAFLIIFLIGSIEIREFMMLKTGLCYALLCCGLFSGHLQADESALSCCSRTQTNNQESKSFAG